MAAVDGGYHVNYQPRVVGRVCYHTALDSLFLSLSTFGAVGK